MDDDDVKAALGELADRHGLRAGQAEQLTGILTVLAEDAAAPSSVTDFSQAVDVHIADSLVALELAVVCDAQLAVDIGAGAGFPGLPLAVALPNCQFELLESQRRKCEYLVRLLRATQIQNASVVCTRAEEWPEGVGAHDLALARALAPPPVVLEYAAPLLRLGGSLVDWRGRRAASEEEDAARAATELGMERVAIERVQPYASVRDHHLHVYVKTSPTPSRFPRRAGAARKKPLPG